MTFESNTREFVTEILDESQLPAILSAVIRVLSKRDVNSVKAQFGFVLKRDLRGEKPPEDCIVPLGQLQTFVEHELREGTIEWGVGSDFRFAAIGLPVQFMICNDSDLHFSSPDVPLLLDLSRALLSRGIKVYDAGKLVEPDNWR